MSERERQQGIQATPPSTPRSLFTDAPPVGPGGDEAPYDGLTPYPGGPGSELPPPKSAVAEVVAGALLGLAVGGYVSLRLLDEPAVAAGFLVMGPLFGMGLGRLTASLTGPTGHLRGLSVPVAMLRILFVATVGLVWWGPLLCVVASHREEDRR